MIKIVGSVVHLFPGCRAAAQPHPLPPHRHTFPHLDGEAGVVQKLEIAGLLACSHHRLSQVRRASTTKPVVVADHSSVGTCIELSTQVNVLIAWLSQVQQAGRRTDRQMDTPPS